MGGKELKCSIALKTILTFINSDDLCYSRLYISALCHWHKVNFAKTELAKNYLFLFKECEGFGDFGTEYELWLKIHDVHMQKK